MTTTPNLTDAQRRMLALFAECPRNFHNRKRPTQDALVRRGLVHRTVNEYGDPVHALTEAGHEALAATR